MTAFASLDAFRAALAALPAADEEARAAALAHQAQLTKPQGSLGQLEEIATFIAAWQGRAKAQVLHPQIVIFAGNHGVCAQGVNPFPQEVTAQMVENFRLGGASINQFAKQAGAALAVVALDLDRPTQDFTQGPAMGEDELLAALNAGAAAIDPDCDILLLGEMGIGNSTTAAALAMASFGGVATDWVGPGTGSDAKGRALKADVVSKAVAVHAQAAGDPLALMARLGGRELAAIAGAVVAARMRRLPVMLDGFICCAALAPLARIDGLLDHCLVGHQSAEPGHARLLQAMGKRGILGLDMRLGEGSGAAVALLIVQAALAMHNGMASFEQAGISTQ